MEKHLVRLECLKLAVTRTPDHPEGLKRAEEYYDFVTKMDDVAPQAQKPEVRNTGNAKPSK